MGDREVEVPCRNGLILGARRRFVGGPLHEVVLGCVERGASAYAAEEKQAEGYAAVLLLEIGPVTLDHFHDG